MNRRRLLSSSLAVVLAVGSVSVTFLFVTLLSAEPSPLEVFGIELGGKSRAVKEEPQKPLPPKFVRLSLDNSKKAPIISVRYEATEGTKSGYDTVYYAAGKTVDAETGKKLTTKPNKSAGRVTCAYKPCKMHAGGDKDGEKKKQDECTVTFCYCRSAGRDTFCVMATRKANGGGSDWEFSSKGAVEVADSLEKAKVTQILPAPELKVETKPDLQKKGNLGIGLTLAAANRAVECKRDGKPLKATVSVRTPQGEELHLATEQLDKFAFG